MEFKRENKGINFGRKLWHIASGDRHYWMLKRHERKVKRNKRTSGKRDESGS